jgi:ABC-2 type transport system ATP-binding protein
MPTIEAINLTKKYGAFTALSNLNLKLEGTKCVGFLGPNGSGKTTTLKMFTDLIRPSSGQALINGVDVSTQKKKALESVSALIETPEIYASLTPREALSMIAEIRGVPKNERNKRIEDAVAEVHMENWIDKRVGKFSKGMKQRICIASTLLSNPSIIILDEPTSGLDPRGMSEVREIIKSLKGKDRLIFMSSHLLGEVSDVCDEVALINRGNLIIYDTIGHVTAKFSGGKNVVEVGFQHAIDDKTATEIIPAFPNVMDAKRIDERNMRIKFSGGLPSQGHLLKQIVDLNVGVVSYKPASSDLEDAYLKLITNTV